MMLDTLDSDILTLIERRDMHPSEISRRTGVIRTKIQYRLKRIEKLGLASKRFAGRKTLWFATRVRHHNKNRMRLYERSDFTQAYEQLLSSPKGTTILFVQGSRAAQAEVAGLPQSLIRDAHRISKRRKFVLRGITNEKALHAFSSLEKTLIESHIGRTLGVKMFRDTHFLSAGEIMSTKKLLLIANPETKRAIVVKDIEITAIVYDILDVMLEILDEKNSFDLNKYLRTVIAKG